MTILLHCRPDRRERWAAALAAVAGDSPVRVWPDVGPRAAVEVVVAMSPLPEPLSGFPGLRFLATTGAGVDAFLRDPATIPPGLPIVRLVDPTLTRSMAEYVLSAVLFLHRDLHHYARRQRACEWSPRPRCDPAERPVGILGMGVLGRAAAELLAGIGFPVMGWSRTARSMPGVVCLHGPEGLAELAARARILVCLLPLTAETRGILGRPLFDRLAPGAGLVNAGRGGHLVESDLLAALDGGRLEHAVLDVFADEPLPPAHPFWLHPGVTVTPHVASLTVPETAAAAIADALARARRGEPLPNQVDRGRGY
ncbi:glyoxylate/hydroxypyruvate reductase A [Allostella vacuolata]|nr:glyoxylate/hydroxypyruvate reductase A [Stella vacuolata]